MTNLKTFAAMLFALAITLSCKEAVSDASEEDNTEQTDETPNTDAVQDETPAEEVEDTPQTVEERIQEIKGLYAKIQGSPNQNKDCTSKIKSFMNYDVVEQGIPLENNAKKCQLEDNLMYQQVTLKGYEWSETCNFYYEDGQKFFTFLSGGAEACGYDYRVYYDKDGEVIRVLLAENDCDGQDVSAPFEVMDSTKKKEILDAVNYAEKEMASILNEK